MKIKKNGFTMVELMIVIAIISVLATIIMPKFTGARDKSKLEACKGHLKSIGIAMEMYGNDNNGDRGPAGGVNLDDSCYLVTGNYIKTVRCPLNNVYRIWAHYSGGWCTTYNMPLDLPLAFCQNPSNQHPGYAYECPYVWAGQVRDRH